MSDSLSEKKREFKRKDKLVRQLAQDISVIIDEHNSYQFTSPTAWFESFPISTLADSLNQEHGKKTSNFSLSDLNKKSVLRRMHLKKVDEYELAKYQRTIAHIDIILERINRVL